MQRAQCFLVSIWTQTNVTHSSPGAGKRDELKMKLGDNTLNNERLSLVYTKFPTKNGEL